MKILFLDIDGVLNSTRTCIAFGGYPLELDQIGAFDQVAIRLLQRLCDSGGVQVVLSSAWRNSVTCVEASTAFGLPIIDKTGNELGPRGLQIQAWLDRHPDNIECFAIIDDDDDMLAHHSPFFVNTDGNEGMTYADFRKLCLLFNESPYAGSPRNRNWRERGQTLDWSEA